MNVLLCIFVGTIFGFVGILIMEVIAYRLYPRKYADAVAALIAFAIAVFLCFLFCKFFL